jgi:hypothetical protein
MQAARRRLVSLRNKGARRQDPKPVVWSQNRHYAVQRLQKENKLSINAISSTVKTENQLLPR